jgi:hypothetical protein
MLKHRENNSKRDNWTNTQQKDLDKFCLAVKKDKSPLITEKHESSILFVSELPRDTMRKAIIFRVF